MQTAKMIGAILLGIVAFSFVHAQLGVVVAVMLALVAGALLLLRKKPGRNHTSVDGPDSSTGASGSHSGDSSKQGATPAFQNMLDMDQHTYVIMANNSRISQRGATLRAHSEVLDLGRKNRELEAEVERLNKEMNAIWDALEDPFADMPQRPQKIG